MSAIELQNSSITISTHLMKDRTEGNLGDKKVFNTTEQVNALRKVLIQQKNNIEQKEHESDKRWLIAAVVVAMVATAIGAVFLGPIGLMFGVVGLIVFVAGMSSSERFMAHYGDSLSKAEQLDVLIREELSSQNFLEFAEKLKITLTSKNVLDVKRSFDMRNTPTATISHTPHLDI